MSSVGVVRKAMPLNSPPTFAGSTLVYHLVWAMSSSLDCLSAGHYLPFLPMGLSPPSMVGRGLSLAFDFPLTHACCSVLALVFSGDVLGSRARDASGTRS